MLKFANDGRLGRPAGALLGALLLLSGFSVFAQAPEFRGIWVDAWGTGFLNSSQTTQLIADARAYNYNAILVQMRRRGDSFYTALPGNDPKTTAISSSYDALADIIAKAHSGSPRIEVHCWVTTQVIWGDGALPTNPNHVVNLHPEYLMKNSSGATLMAEGLYLDPGHPDAARWNFTMATNIARQYDIDGFHWDYIRYPQQDSGYSETAIARYNAEFGLTGQPSYTSSQFSTWRRRQVTDFMRWANAELLGIKSNLVVSASVFGSRSDAYTYRFQDWAAWNTEGLLDVCIPMIYSDNNTTFTTRANDAYSNQGIRRVYPGPGAYLNTKENTLWQLNYCRSKPFYGTSFYSYRVPNVGTVDRAGTLSYIRDNYQPTWENTPTLPWKSSPTRGLVKGYVFRSDNGAPVYNATVKLYSPIQRTIKSEAHGHYAFFDAQAGTYYVTATATGYGSVTNQITLTPSGVVHQDLVLPATDTTPPVISDIAATSVTSSNAVINWSTDDLANSAVDYGATTSYGSTVSNSTWVTSHALTLAPLTPSTLYHFRVRSRNASGLSSTSPDNTFMTPAVGVPDLIIESRLAGGAKNTNPPYEEGTGWSDSSAKSTAAWLTGTGSRFSGSASSTFSWRPTVPVAGAGYDVYMTHHALAGSISSNIVIGVTQTGCTGLPATTTIFQNPGGNTWEYLGRMNVNPGVSEPVVSFYYVSGSVGSSGQRWYADGVKFVYATPPPAPPSIDIQPADIGVIQGANASFFVTASGTSPLSYQWRFDGAVIPGATFSSYAVNVAQPEKEGAYTVVVTNIAGSVTSAPAILTVFIPPSIGSQPLSQTVVQGSNAFFEVTVGGTEPFHYQWRFNGANIPGANEGEYTVFNAQPSSQGAYTVVITNIAGARTSSVATLTIVAAPEISAGPASRTNTAGTDASFTVTATGSAPLSYQWLFEGAPITGATTPAYTRQKAINTDQGAYSVVVTNAAAAITSPPALLTVSYPVPPSFLSVTQGPGNNVAISMTGGPGQFRLQASPDLFNWTNRTTILATNLNFETEDTVQAGGQLFYRLKREP